MSAHFTMWMNVLYATICKRIARRKFHKTYSTIFVLEKLIENMISSQTKTFVSNGFSSLLNTGTKVLLKSLIMFQSSFLSLKDGKYGFTILSQGYKI